LTYNNGYSVPKRPVRSVGGEKLTVGQLTEAELDQLAEMKPSLTYGQATQPPPEDFVPAHVAFDKKVLLFEGFFKQTVHESPDEYYRVRPVKVRLYLVSPGSSETEIHHSRSTITWKMIVLVLWSLCTRILAYHRAS
jgi:hypothetical protein